MTRTAINKAVYEPMLNATIAHINGCTNGGLAVMQEIRGSTSENYFGIWANQTSSHAWGLIRQTFDD